MADVTAQLKDVLSTALRAAFGDDYADADPMLGPANNPKFGDYQANLAMKLGKQLGKPPREIAQAVVDNIDTGALIEKVEIAGPGFINLHLSAGALAEAAHAMLTDDRLGVPKLSAPQTVVVDYSSPNVAKEMHVGHLRSTVIGDAIARVLSFQGHDVIRQNHVGDWGTQFGKVMLGLWYEAAAIHFGKESLLEGWINKANPLAKGSADESESEKAERLVLQEELLNLILPVHRRWYEADQHGGVYFLDYVEEKFPDIIRLQELYTFASAITGMEAAKFEQYSVSSHDSPDDRLFSELPSYIATYVQRQLTTNDKAKNRSEYLAWLNSRRVTLDACQDLYDRLGVQLTNDESCARGESFYTLGSEQYPGDKLEKTVQALDEVDLLRVSQGSKVVFPQGFFNRDEDPLPVIVQKSDGGYLYATTDLAAIRFRIDELKATRIAYVTDARQSQHFAMVFQVAKEAGWLTAGIGLEHVPFGTVMGEDGRPFKTRDGGTVRLVDLIDEAESRAIAVCKDKNPELAGEEAENVGKVVGLGSLKYADLSSDRVKDYKFSWDRMLALDGNTAPYLINAYVRVHGIFRKGEIDFASFASDHVEVQAPAEKTLVLKLMQFGSTVDSVADSLEPHRLCNYLYDLASAYHKFFESCPVLKSDVPEDVREGRLALCKLVALTLERGLGLLGIGVVERM